MFTNLITNNKKNNHKKTLKQNYSPNHTSTNIIISLINTILSLSQTNKKTMDTNVPSFKKNHTNHQAQMKQIILYDL